MINTIRTSILKTAFLFGLVVSSLLSSAQQYDFSGLTSTLETNQKSLGKDLVMMVWKDDTLVYKKELGDFKTKTVAPLGDASKWLTAALVMQFVDEGKIDLDDKVARWIPEFERYGKNYITIRHCLANLTGIRDDGSASKKAFQRKKFSSLEEEVNSFAARDIRVNAGQDFWYGDIGANIAARVLEIISRKKFDILIKQKLFTPLTMRRTTFSTLDASAIDPSSGAQTTAEEFMKFMSMLLNKGMANGRQILSEASVEELKKIHTSPKDIRSAPKSATGLNYALGSWVLDEEEGKTITLAIPGITWPMINFCKGYASIVFVKSQSGEEKSDIHYELKRLMEEQFTGDCK